MRRTLFAISVFILTLTSVLFFVRPNSKSDPVPVPEPIVCDSVILETALFEEAVECIKKHEGWHTADHHPYVGYGHKLLPGETYPADISGQTADSLLRRDLLQKCSVFRQFGKDSLILGVLAYNVGEYTLLGMGTKPPSSLIKKLEAGDRDIYGEYLSFRKYNGTVVHSIEQRRRYEYELLFDKTRITVIKNTL